MRGEGARDTVALAPHERAGEPIYPSVVVGQVLAGKYRVERLLGEGGMGVVVAAEHIDLHERVAMKLMRPDTLDSSEAVQRFLREARAAVKIRSEHVARVLDAGNLETGEPYIVMEYLEGTDLGALLDENGPLPIKEAVEYVLQACEALAEAHALGIIHRDVKPANLFLARRPDGSALIKIIDFGISRIVPRRTSLDPGNLCMTKTSQVLGTPLYMAPEQIDSPRKADMASDIWSLGAILFELLTGDVPFDAGTLQELRRQICVERAPALRSRRPEASRALEAIVERCLEKDPEKRYPNVSELAAALARFAPARARLSVSRIHRIIESAGLGSTPPQEFVPPGSVSATPGLRESLDRARTRARRWPIAAGFIMLFMALASPSIFAQFSVAWKASAASPRAAPGNAPPPASPTTPQGAWRDTPPRRDEWRAR